MNKDIKFRAWDAEENKFWYFTLQEILERRMSYRGSWDDKILRCEKTQYIGLNDKNGKEIYEGDILKDEFDRKFYVYWVSNEARFAIRQKNRKSEYFMVINHLKIEVIGNIYENPDLLEVANGQH